MSNPYNRALLGCMLEHKDQTITISSAAFRTKGDKLSVDDGVVSLEQTITIVKANCTTNPDDYIWVIKVPTTLQVDPDPVAPPQVKVANPNHCLVRIDLAVSAGHKRNDIAFLLAHNAAQLGIVHAKMNAKRG